MTIYRIDHDAPVITLYAEIKGAIIARVNMALDTGATYVLITWDIAETLGHEPAYSKQKVDITTASGTEKVPLITVSRISVLGMEARDVPCIVLDGRYDYLSLRKPTKRVLDEYEVTATFFVVADVVEHYLGLVESIVSVNSLYNKTDSSLEGVSSHPYYPQKTGLEMGEEKFVESPWAYWDVFGFKVSTSDAPVSRCACYTLSR